MYIYLQSCLFSVRRAPGGKFPLWNKGERTVKAPVFVSDVAAGIMQAIKNPDTAGQTFECVG